MPVYEFMCPKGHVTEDLVPIGIKQWPCGACVAEAQATGTWPDVLPAGKRILSPTPTTFEFADKRRR